MPASSAHPWRPDTPAWRITAINLDDYEQLLSVTVVVQAAAVDRIRQLVNDGAPIQVLRGSAALGKDALMWIELSAPQARVLWRSSRDTPRDDPRYVPGMTESLSKIADLLEGT